MDETPNAIEAHIDRTRERLGSNLKELEDRVGAATNWREHFRHRPQLFLGAAFVGGVILASAVRGKAWKESAGSKVPRVANGGYSVHAQTMDFWNNLKGALVGVASARIREYIGDLVPGLDEHFRRAEQRAGAGYEPAAGVPRGKV